MITALTKRDKQSWEALMAVMSASRHPHPPQDLVDYLNRMLFPSIQPQAVCDKKGLFINTFMGYPSSVLDVRVLKNSRIYKEASFSPLKYFIVADGGYPCIERPVAIITPHRVASC
ncbi:hypothetical protein GJAV_G00232970 [Gymnothorax javanicus]|nr:hypothetical protein GJAV_G00232970 [Gymnothorax javanicus]